MKHEINATHRALKGWLAARNHSPEIARAGQFVLCGLWACANNRKPCAVLVGSLAGYVAAFECAVSESRRQTSQRPTP